jgi:hypothetical protein
MGLRLYAAGIKKFRSNSQRIFYLRKKTKYRNIPEWQIPIELQK